MTLLLPSLSESGQLKIALTIGSGITSSREPCASTFHLHCTSSCSWHHYDATLQVGRERPGPRLTQWLSWDWKPGCIPGSRQPQECAGMRASNKCTVRVQETTPRGSAGLARPHTLPPHHQGRLEDEARAQGAQAGSGSPQQPLWAGSRLLPAPCKLWAQGQAGSSCPINPAQVLSALVPTRMRPHLSAPSWLRC